MLLTRDATGSQLQALASSDTGMRHSVHWHYCPVMRSRYTYCSPRFVRDVKFGIEIGKKSDVCSVLVCSVQKYQISRVLAGVVVSKVHNGPLMRTFIIKIISKKSLMAQIKRKCKPTLHAPSSV